MGKTNEAVELMEQYLSLKYGLTRIQVIEKVQSVFAETYDIESCEYHFLGGALNCGFIETVVLDPYSKKSKTLLTKLVEGEQNRDETFYRVVYPLVETLHPMIPKLIDLRTLQGLTLLTTEKVEGRTPSEEDFKTVLDASRVIEAIPFGRIMAIFNALDINIYERFFVTRRSLLQSYWNIYLTLASKTDNPAHIYTVFTRQYRMLRDIKIHHLAIDANYSFCHGDFHKDNILVQNGTVIILDWTHYKLAPLGNDVEYYFHIYQDHFPDFSEIRQRYLDQRFPLHGDARQNAVSILLFIHQVTRSRVIRLKHGELEADYERFFLPAVEYAIDIASRYLGYRTPGR